LLAVALFFLFLVLAVLLRWHRFFLLAGLPVFARLSCAARFVRAGLCGLRLRAPHRLLLLFGALGGLTSALFLLVVAHLMAVWCSLALAASSWLPVPVRGVVFPPLFQALLPVSGRLYPFPALLAYRLFFLLMGCANVSRFSFCAGFPAGFGGGCQHRRNCGYGVPSLASLARC